MTASPPTKAQIAEAFSPGVLSSLRDFWFHGLSEEDLILPPLSAAARWFQRNEEFDQACYSNFKTQIQLMQSDSLTITSLIAAISANYPKCDPSDPTIISPLDWLSLIILFDQIPRNVFRDADAKIVFTVTDPKALDLACYVIKYAVPLQPPVWNRLAYRFWFYLPLEHSEDPKVQNECVREHADMFRDLKEFISMSEAKVATFNDEFQRCYQVIKERKDDLAIWEDALMEKYVLGHKRIIDRFGRYPHRNEVLGRESTEEEVRYLTEGGETFGGKKAE
ncbi:peptidase aspartic, active site [Rhypophila decipiens]